MGLDQFAYKRNKNEEPKKDEDGREIYPDFIFDWRKHARLQVFMARLFKDKFPKSHEGSYGLGFNGEELELDLKDIEALEDEIKNDYYGCFASDGFFWGQQFQEDQVKHYKAQDIEFVEWSKEELHKNNKVIYNCSW